MPQSVTGLLKNNLYTRVILSEAKNLAARPFASLRVTIPERALVSRDRPFVKFISLRPPKAYGASLEKQFPALGQGADTGELGMLDVRELGAVAGGEDAAFEA